MSSGRDSDLVSHRSTIVVAEVSDSVTTRVGGVDNNEVVRAFSRVPRYLSVLTLGKGRRGDCKSERALDGNGSNERNSKECGEHLIYNKDRKS